VILHFNFEELTALRSGAQVFLEREEAGGGAVLAPGEERVRVAAFLERLDGDITLSTLAEVRAVQEAVSAIVRSLRVELETVVLATHVADEDAVAAYFDFAHVFTVEHRLREMASEMEALIELVTGAPATEQAIAHFQFPD
jgi:hypothetical protein